MGRQQGLTSALAQDAGTSAAELLAEQGGRRALSADACRGGSWAVAARHNMIR